MDTTDDTSALDPAGMLALAERQQDDVQRRMAAGVPVILAGWAVAIAGSFLAFWLISGLAPAVELPQLAAIVIFGALWLAAMTVSIVVSLRIRRGIRTLPAQEWTGTVYGIAWPLLIGAVVALQLGLSANGLGDGTAEVLLPVGISAGVGLLYFIGGGIWRSGIMVGMGLAMLIGSLAAPFAGVPHHFLVLAIVGGLTFAVGAVLTARYAQPSGMWS